MPPKDVDTLYSPTANIGLYLLYCVLAVFVCLVHTFFLDDSMAGVPDLVKNYCMFLPLGVCFNFSLRSRLRLFAWLLLTLFLFILLLMPGSASLFNIRSLSWRDDNKVLISWTLVLVLSISVLLNFIWFRPFEREEVFVSLSYKLMEALRREPW